jgi:DNA-binding beta-propeller fold protein YncE
LSDLRGKRSSVSVKTVVPALLALMAAVGIATAQSGPSTYHVVREIKLGGDGRWDYITIDTAQNRLFIARQTRIMVVDQASGKLLGEIPGIDGAHGVALDYNTGHGFATAGRSGTVTMFDLKTLTVLGAHPAADDADAILYDPVSRKVFTFNGDANSSSVIDPVSGRSVGTIPLQGKPEFGVSAGDGKLYVNIEDKSEIAEIDGKSRRVLRRWPIAPCTEPTGLAIDRAHHLLFSGCHNKVMAISDAHARKLISTVPIGGGVDGDAFDPATGLAFSSNGEGSLTVVHEESATRFRSVATVPTRQGARTMALDPRSHRIYTVTADFGTPPPATEQDPHPRPPVVPDTFTLLVLER